MPEGYEKYIKDAFLVKFNSNYLKYFNEMKQAKIQNRILPSGQHNSKALRSAL
jgi:hypothetical protein